jgi:tetratricopeptide (TPR) repeat protein
VVPPDDSSSEPGPAEQPDEPRHPFTYRAPAPRVEEEEPADEITAADVADEARRNDAVLRGAAVLMALAFACTTIADPRALVHVATGKYIASHGYLPPRTDVFSATAEGRPWVNLGWLFDLAAAGLHAVGGMTALTVLKAAAAVGLAVLLFACRRTGVSSWWASFVVVLTAVAAMPQLDASPELVTLLGLGITLWLLTRYRHEDDARSVFWLVPVYLVWANLDPRMFLGPAALLLYGAGEAVGALLGRSGFEEGSLRGRYWLAVAGSAAATLVHPFWWHAPLGALRLYGHVDPAYREYYGDDASWIALPHESVFDWPRAALLDTAFLAAALLAAVALAAMVLNRRRLDFGDAALWLGFVGFGLFTGREWPAASVVFAVVAIQNAEQWYRSSFRQTYGTERAELLFSRGGRAVTVIAFAALAALWLMGKIVADDGRRPGFGLDPALARQTASLSRLLKDPYDREVFDFQATQGDLLIWLGFRPFIDDRLELYSGRGGEDLIALHDRARRGMRAAPAADDPYADPGAGRPEVWKPALERFGIVQALPRLTFPAPAYRTYFDLLRSPDWRLTGLDSAAAFMLRADATDPKVAAYIEAHLIDVTRAAFREPSPPAEPSAAWPQRRSWLDSLTRPAPLPDEFIRATHYLQHLEQAEIGAIRIPPQAGLAFAHLALRDFYRALARDPQSAAAYLGLGRVYSMLYLWETRVLQLGGSDARPQMRLTQAIDSYGQALAIDPDGPAPHQRLMELYLRFNKADLAEQERDTCERLTGRDPTRPDDPGESQQWELLWDRLRGQIDAVSERARDAVEKGQPRLEAALFAWQNGCTLLALELIDEEPELAEKSAEVKVLRAMLLLEAARPREAYDLLAPLEDSARELAIARFRDPFAHACLALPDFDRAAAVWRDEARDGTEREMIASMQAVALAGPPNGPSLGRASSAPFPSWQTTTTARAMFEVPQEIARAEFNVTMCELEAGETEAAGKGLDSLLARHPLTAYTPLAVMYFEQIQGQAPQLDLRDTEERPDRYSPVEARLDDAAVKGRIKSAGPVIAPKPAELFRGLRPRERAGLTVPPTKP